MTAKVARPKSYTYENVSGQDQTVVGVGHVPKGKTIAVTEPFSNPNFSLVKDTPAPKEAKK